MKYFFITFLGFYSITLPASASYNFEFKNKVYDENIRTVTLEVNDNPVVFPKIELNSSQTFVLKFDDLLNEERTYFYRIIHCDKNWKPSEIRELDYLSGFNDERLRKYEYSVNTRKPFIHYYQRFPNNDTRFRISGNYVLVIYEDNIETPILTRRFLVIENKVSVEMINIFPADVQNIRYKHEFQININYGSFKMRNAMEEVSLIMLQNENWNEVIESKPSFFTSSQLRFNKLKTFQWWGLSEFRDFDIRTVFRLGRGVQFINRSESMPVITLVQDELRARDPHVAKFDFNGRFFIDNFEYTRSINATDVLLELENQVNADPNIRATLRDSLINSLNLDRSNASSQSQAAERDLRSDYTKVNFILNADMNLEDSDIYILGMMNNWEPSEEFKMHFDSKRLFYTAEVLLKQGYYNYCYAIVDKNNKVDIAAIEGSWNETENDYQALVYYRGIGDLYDRLIGYASVNSNVENIR